MRASSSRCTSSPSTKLPARRASYAANTRPASSSFIASMPSVRPASCATSCGASPPRLKSATSADSRCTNPVRPPAPR